VFALPLALLVLASPAATGHLHHDLEVRVEPVEHRIDVTDRVTIPRGIAAGEGQTLRFVLHAGLELLQPVDGYDVELLDGVQDGTRYGINEGAAESGVALREYLLTPADGEPAEERILELRYRGKIHHPLVEESEEYARSFSRTPGTIEEQGVVLSGSTWWLPAFGEGLLTFRLAVDLPQEWDAVSQGARTRHEIVEGRRRVVWDSPEPMDEAYLIAAKFVEYDRPAGEVTAYAFLRGEEPNLAAKYLEATVQYVEMYRKLIGPYPYGKFALIENFWDTGYGMPSFTLLGPRIIRFPFILHSSYPHEILHNWWGNSVFVDYESGNWCEGLTAYLADHLIKEGQGQGVNYRRDTLKKYRNFVRGEQDFALTEFRSRHSSATEAVGYGKSLMLWHMLRRRIGDDKFVLGLARFYRGNKFRKAGFEDLEASFTDAAGEDLSEFFSQWVDRTGAPEIKLDEVIFAPVDGGITVMTVALRQVQDGEPYRLDVPVAVTLEGETEARLFTLEMNGATGILPLNLPAHPQRIDVDPEFDLFRRLDPFEIPASLGQVFGAERGTIVLPEGSDSVPAADWAAFAESWVGENEEQIEIVTESEIEGLPGDRAVWILGSANRWAEAVRSEMQPFEARVTDDGLETGQESLPRADHCFAFVVRNPEDPDLALGWIGAERADALPGLARKLPHYGKYSYVAFSGAEPTNVAKGQWPVLRSPLVRFVGEGVAPRGALPTREPLARLEPVFDPLRLMSHVEYLASDETEGRGVGTAGLDLAIEYVARVFQAAGLEPGGDDGSYFQVWTEPDGPGGEPVELRNVIGVLPGTDPERAGESVVLGAHLDHLGHGWPDVRQGAEGMLHPGADDNASGVAVMLELAELLGRELRPSRDVVFAAFTAEEWSLRGSRHFVEHDTRWPLEKMMAMLNLDTVGRLHEQKITVFGTGNATEWVHIVMGIGFTTGIQAKSVSDDLGGSDQKSFTDRGVPAVQIFSGAHEDYHRPSDRVESIDAAGLVKVATFAREALVYLSERESPMTSKLEAQPGDSAAPPTPSSSPSGRRVSLGTLPDFAFPGPGVKVVEVLPGTPAEKAGLEPGDLIVTIDGDDIADVRAYAGILRAHEPGDTVRIRVVRYGEEIEVEAVLVAR